MRAERPRRFSISRIRDVVGASSCLQSCGGVVAGRILFVVMVAGVEVGMALLIGYAGAPITLASLFVLLVVLFEFWPREPYPPRSKWRWLYYGPIAGLIVSLCYTIYLEAQDSEDVDSWALVSGGMLALLWLVSKIDKWLRGEKEEIGE